MTAARGGRVPSSRRSTVFQTSSSMQNNMYGGSAPSGASADSLLLVPASELFNGGAGIGAEFLHRPANSATAAAAATGVRRAHGPRARRLSARPLQQRPQIPRLIAGISSGCAARSRQMQAAAAISSTPGPKLSITSQSS